MTSEELRQQREERWNGWAQAGPRSDGVGRFLEEAGFALFTAGGGLPLPGLDRLIAATSAGAEGIGLEQLQRSLDAALRAHAAVELNLWRGTHVYCAAELLPFIYVQIGDHKPSTDFRQLERSGKLTPLAAIVYETLQELRSATVAGLRGRLGSDRTSGLSVERALQELAQTLKVVRTGREERGEAVWKPLYLAFPDAAAAVQQLTKVEAAGALLAKYLGLMVAEQEEALAEFFVPLFSRGRTHTALLGLEAGGEVERDQIDGRPAWRLQRHL